MKLLRLSALFLLFPLWACLRPANPLKPYRLKSGRVIYPKQTMRLVAPNMPNEKGMVYSYQTLTNMDDQKSLRLEADEIWIELRPEFEKMPGITMAIIQAEQVPQGRFIQQTRNYRFVVTRKPDGSWEWVDDKPDHGGK